MKDIKSCSISSVAFTLEIDAYDTLFNYIEALRDRYATNSDGEEIIADIESRIAELILSAHGADRVVAKPLIDNIIAQLGSVDDICDNDQSTDNQSDNAQNQSHESGEQPKTGKKLYRNIDDAPIGGVCSGVAAYIGCDAAIVRIIALALLFCGGISIWVYLALWAVIPSAVTVHQKLEMRGEPITISTLNDYYNSLVNDKQYRSFASRVLSFVGRLLLIILKVFLTLILVSLLFLFFSLITIAFAMVVVVGSVISLPTAAILIMIPLSLGILLALAIYVIFQIINSREIKGSHVLATLLIWLFFSACTICTIAANTNSLNEVREIIRVNNPNLNFLTDNFRWHYSSQRSAHDSQNESIKEIQQK